MKSFADVLKDGDRLFFDGATGTQLLAKGAPLVGPMANIEAPDVVVAVHRSYVNVGSQAVLTNTLTANRLALSQSGNSDLVEKLNREGVRLCRKAAEGRAYVVGDMGSTGFLLEPYGDYTEEQFHEVYVEQARILSDAGVDAIAIETMTDLRELQVAIKACKEVTSVPVIGLMRFDPGANGYRTMMGVSPDDAAKGIEEAGADAMGTNCGTVGPVDVAAIIGMMKEVTDLPLIAEPNAGKPLLSGGKVTYADISIEEFAAGCAEIVAAGVQLIGGCCGTDPEHILAMIGLLR